MTNVLEKLPFLLHCAVHFNMLYLKGLYYGLVDLNTWSPKSGTVYQAYENFRKSQGGWIAEGSGPMCVGVGLEIHIVVPLSVLSLFSDSQGFEINQS